MAQLITEEWRPVVGYEGIYEVSDLGRVKSLSRVRMTGRGPRRTTERLLQHKPGTYPEVTLSRLRDPKTRKVHTLVLTSFVGPRPTGMEACHADGDKWNPSLANLRWDTVSGNHADRVRHGVSNRGERSGSAALTSIEVTELRSRYSSGGIRQRDLADAFGVSQAQISHIINRKAWTA